MHWMIIEKINENKDEDRIRLGFFQWSVICYIHKVLLKYDRIVQVYPIIKQENFSSNPIIKYKYKNGGQRYA